MKRIIALALLCLLALPISGCTATGGGTIEPSQTETNAEPSKEPTNENTTPTAEPTVSQLPEVFDESSHIWKLDPTLEYDTISFFHNIFGFVGYTVDYQMYVLDGQTGQVIGDAYATGGFGDPYYYGYYAETDTFLYNIEYAYHPAAKEDVVLSSQNKAICVVEIVKYIGDGYEYYDGKQDGKCAVYINGDFVSDYVYDYVIGGNSVAFVMQNGKFAFADMDGKLLTEFIFDDVGVIADGFIAAGIDDKWFFVDKHGNAVIPYGFEHIVNIDGSTAFVKYNGRYGILDVQKTLANQMAR